MFLRIALILAASFLWLTSTRSYSGVATNSDFGQVFKFRFELNKPLIYDLDFKLRSVNDYSIGTRSSLSRKTFETHYKVRLTAVETNQDGTTSVLLEPFDFNEDVEVVNASGRINTTVRGLDIVSKQNDIVMVDTKNGIGMGQADPMKFPIFPYLLSGYLLFDSAGNVKNYSGDLPFIDVWRNRLKPSVGFFNIVFPTNAVAIKDTWTNSIFVKESGGTTYDGDGIVQPSVFVRELDSTTNNAPVACFSLYESDNYQHLGAHSDQSGQQTTIDFPERTESMNGTFHFDQKLGRLIDMKRTDTLQDSLTWMAQGTPATGHDDNQAETTIQLVSP